MAPPPVVKIAPPVQPFTDLVAPEGTVTIRDPAAYVAMLAQMGFQATLAPNQPGDGHAVIYFVDQGTVKVVHFLSACTAIKDCKELGLIVYYPNMTDNADWLVVENGKFDFAKFAVKHGSLVSSWALVPEGMTRAAYRITLELFVAAAINGARDAVQAGLMSTGTDKPAGGAGGGKAEPCRNIAGCG